ncbi:hypothetical protein GTY53_06135 [Streptomyces sp. SID7805]|uniref:hypothetical protein n=1 Tax=Streptomyces celluloflavus TaxID=58344 RepID=UPI001415F796|nr:hypothetical protein [Streptomyces sp. SID7805]MYU51590.1 hypothetical protein [Streptomyces sp. SID7805]
MAFDGSGVPVQGESGDDGVAVSADAGGQSVEAGQVVLPDGVEPVRQTLTFAAGEHGREGPDVAGEELRTRYEIRAFLHQGLLELACSIIGLRRLRTTFRIDQ